MATLDDVVNAIKGLQSSIDGERAATSVAYTEADLEERKEIVEELKEELRKLREEEENLQKVQEKEIQIQDAIIEREETSLKLAIQNKQISEEDAKLKRKEISNLKKEARQLRKNTDAKRENVEATEMAFGALSRYVDVSKDYDKSLIKSIKAINQNSEAQKELGDRLKKNYSAANIAAKTFGKVMPYANVLFARAFTEVQQGIASFNQATGMADMFAQQIAASSRDLREFGVTSGDVGTALTALGQAFPLNQLGESAVGVAKQFALYEKFGISAQASAAAFTDLTRSLGRTNEESMATISNIGELGRQLGVGAGKLVEDFAQALPRLAIYGNEAEKIFRNVATTSSRLGLSVDDILALSEGLQTFEGSAQAAGRLNAILGGGFIDNLELMEAAFENPAEAAMMIKDAFSSAGMSVESMGPAAIKAAAAAAGFSDANKFRRFIEGELSATEALGDDQKDLQLDANEIAKRSQTTLERIEDAITKQTQALMGDLPLDVADALQGVGSAALSGIGIAGLFGGGIAKDIGMRGLGSLVKSRGTRMAGPPSVAPRPGQAGFIGPIQQRPGLGARFAGLGRFGGMALRGAGAAGSIAMVGKDAYDIATGDASGENIGGVAGGVVGGLIGGALGSVVPVVGTAIGASLGAAAGNLLGNTIGKTFDSSMPSKTSQKTSSSAPSKSVVEHKHVVEIIQDTTNAERFVKAVYRKDLSSVT